MYTYTGNNNEKYIKEILENKNNNNIHKNYENLDILNSNIVEYKDKSKILNINIDKTKNIKNFQYYETIIIVFILIIFIILTVVFNLNNKSENVKYLLPFLILLFIIIHFIDIFYINIEKFETPRSPVNNLEDFKTIIKGFPIYSEYINTLNNYEKHINNAKNYSTIYKILTGGKLGNNNSEHLDLNKLITSFEIINVITLYIENKIMFAFVDSYIYKINQNLKKEVDKYKNVKESVKSASYRIQEQYNNLYMTTLSYRDIIYFLIYLTIISILINVIIIEYKLDYVDKKILALYIFLFFIGIVVYLYRYMIRVRVNPHKKYF